MRDQGFLIGPVAALALLATAASPLGPITPAGARIAQLIDSLDVEHHWRSGESVSWRTGQPNPRGGQHATHCSAFVAAVGDRLGIYILRPPEHGQELLANAQNAWLKSAGPSSGWRRVRSPVEAQALANRGELVVASYANPDPHKPGHIAVVRPYANSERAIVQDGPRVAQAGKLNSSSTSLRQGFSHHPGAWDGHRVEFFAHPIAGR